MQNPLQSALVLSADGPVYAYDMIFKTPEITAVGRVDPSAEEGKRITVTSPAPEDWPEEFAEGLAEMDKDVDGNIWCSQFADTIPASATLQEETGTTARYTFTPIPDPADENDAKIMKHIQGTVVIDTREPAILSYQLTAPKPFKPAVVAKIETFDMRVSCARAPDGRTYVQDMSVHVAGSAMMQSFEEKMSRQITALYPAG